MKRNLNTALGNRRPSPQTPERRMQQDEKTTMKKTPTTFDDLLDADFPQELAAEEETSGSSGGADDALGLYLKQMGAIPLLNREKELSLAMRLEKSRKRYRRAVLFSWWSIERIVGMFERIQAG